MNFTREYFGETISIANQFNYEQIEKVIKKLDDIRFFAGRVFVLGIGGSSGNASHFVNDLRKICGIEAYAPTDQVPYMTAITNDESWDNVFWKYLETSHFSSKDAVFVLSVSGNTLDSNTSKNLLLACDYADKRGGTIFGIVGKDYGMVAQHYPEYCVVVPHLGEYKRCFPHSESFQGVICHCIVSHPLLQKEIH
jgi:D-sedoheptulose 7-phosphate isomerase